MKLFKFGGASVKDASGVRNIVNLLQQVGYDDVLIVISAMGKTTNALEVVLEHYSNNSKELNQSIQEIRAYHLSIVNELFSNNTHPVFEKVEYYFNELTTFLQTNKSPNYNYVYDQVVSIGELLSTTIVSEYLNENLINNTWVDVRDLIKTDANYRDANVDWQITQRNIQNTFSKKSLYITQGFLGSDENNFTTTLGREGSDYTAAIIAYCLNAESVTIWKDVPGVLNADPRYFEKTELLHQISYREAIELAFYGASVIHPKTLQPLQRKEIPLYVKSFVNPLLPGTTVSKGLDISPNISCYIVKKDQKLLSISSRDFSFIMEENISEIFALLHQYKMKVSLIQNSAISFSVCIEDKFHLFESLKNELLKKFQVQKFENVSLFTIRRYKLENTNALKKDKNVLIEQVLGETLQIVTTN